MSITDRLLPAALATKTSPCGLVATTPAGLWPTGTVATTLRVSRSSTETSWLPWLVM